MAQAAYPNIRLKERTDSCRMSPMQQELHCGEQGSINPLSIVMH